MTERFDYTLLDREDPFELDDGNIPKLFQRAPFCPDDAYDVFYGWPGWYEYTGLGSSDWLMVGEVSGGFLLDDTPRPIVLCVPLCKPNSGRVDQARPVSIYLANATLRARYFAES